MKILKVICFATIFLVLAQVSFAEILTNDTIISMVKAGLGESLIISKVKASQNQFELSTDNILKLKKEGVSEKVIQTMVEVSATNAIPEKPKQSKEMLDIQTKGDFFVLKDGKLTEMDYVKGYTEASIGQAFKQHFLFSFKNKTAIIMENVKAKLRLNDPSPVFYTRYNPTEIGIAKFTVQDVKNRRYIFVVSQIGSTLGNIYPKEHDILFDYEKLPEGIYKITLKNSLPTGEYGIALSSYRVYDFGVDQ